MYARFTLRIWRNNQTVRLHDPNLVEKVGGSESYVRMNDTLGR